MTLIDMFFLGVGVLLVSLVNRILVTWNRAPGFDVYGHLLFARTLRDQEQGPYGNITLPIVGASPHSQPFLWHWLVGRFDIEKVLRHQSWINGGIDSVFVLVAFALTTVSGFSPETAIYAALAYLLTPLWFSSVAFGPRIAGFTPRLSSEVATNLFFMVCLLPLGINSVLVLGIGAVLAWFVLSSSKFGLQALLFLAPLTSLFGGGWIPVLAVLIGLFATVLLSWGGAYEMFRTQVQHLVAYCKSNLMGNLEIASRNSFREFCKRKNEGIRPYFRRAIYRLLRDNSYTLVVVKAPSVLLAWSGLLLPYVWGSGVYRGELVAPVLAGTVVFLFVNLRPFLFLGEAERYLNHVAYSVALFGTVFVIENNAEWLLYCTLLYGLSFWFIEVVGLERLKPLHLRQREVEDARIIEDLTTLQRATVLSYPFTAVGGAFRVGIETEHLSVYAAKGCYTDAEFTERFLQKYSDGYPYVRLCKLDELSRELGVDYVIVDRITLKKRGLPDWRPSSVWLRRPVGGSVYDVYYKQK